MNNLITVYQFRDNQELARPSTRTIKDALRMLLLAELGFGGVVTKVDPVKLVVTTPVMGLQDVTVFESTEDDMLLLTEAAYYWAMISSNCIESVRQNLIDKIFKKYPEGTLIRPQELSVGAQLVQILSGERIINGVMAAMMVDEISANLVPELVKKRTDDLFAALTLIRLDHVNVGDAISLMA